MSKISKRNYVSVDELNENPLGNEMGNSPETLTGRPFVLFNYSPSNNGVFVNPETVVSCEAVSPRRANLHFGDGSAICVRNAAHVAERKLFLINEELDLFMLDDAYSKVGQKISVQISKIQMFGFERSSDNGLVSSVLMFAEGCPDGFRVVSKTVANPNMNVIKTLEGKLGTRLDKTDAYGINYDEPAWINRVAIALCEPAERVRAPQATNLVFTDGKKLTLPAEATSVKQRYCVPLRPAKVVASGEEKVEIFYG